VCNCEVGIDGLLCKPGRQVVLTPPLGSLSYALQGIHGNAHQLIEIIENEATFGGFQVARSEKNN